MCNKLHVKVEDRFYWFLTKSNRLCINPIGFGENPIDFCINPVGLGKNPTGFCINPVGIGENPTDFV